MSHSSACHYYELANLLNKHEKGFCTKPVLQNIIIVQQNSSLSRICLKIPWIPKYIRKGKDIQVVIEKKYLIKMRQEVLLS
jgi:hypothetical protein